MKMTSHSCLQHRETQLDEIIIRRIRRKIFDSTVVCLDNVSNARIAMSTSIIHDDKAARRRINVAMR